MRGLSGIRIKWFFKNRLAKNYGPLAPTVDDRDRRRMRMLIVTLHKTMHDDLKKKAYKVLTPFMLEVRDRYGPIAKFEEYTKQVKFIQLKMAA